MSRLGQLGQLYLALFASQFEPITKQQKQMLMYLKLFHYYSVTKKVDYKPTTGSELVVSLLLMSVDLLLV